MNARLFYQAGIIGAGAVIGGVAGAVGHWVTTLAPVYLWTISGALAGVVISVFWPKIRSFGRGLNLEDWHLEEIEVQGFTLTSAGAQRRVAWGLFVEIMTRIAVQPMADEDGDDGVALTSLYELFKSMRTTLAEMELTPTKNHNTVETYALRMLNEDLRPFLSKWHPLWDAHVKARGAKRAAWPEHLAFRQELRVLQAKVAKRAKGLAEIAGVQNVEGFFPKAAGQEPAS